MTQRHRAITTFIASVLALLAIPLLAITPNQDQARTSVVNWVNAGTPPLTSCMPNCGDSIHGNHVYGWLGEALFGTGLSSPDGSGQYHVDDRVRNAAMETTFGQQLFQLYVTDRASGAAGWVTTPYGLRPTWWKLKRNEQNGTEKLTGKARNGQDASVAAVPGSEMSTFWPTSLPPPLDEREYAAILREQVLFPDQYEQLRKHLGIPVTTPPIPCPDGSSPPCVVVPPACPDGQPPPCVVDPPDPPASWIAHVRAALRRTIADLEAALAAIPEP